MTDKPDNSDTLKPEAQTTATSQKPIVRVRNLSKSFGGVKVLDGISFDLYPGEMLVIMGGSGCGKSTCLRCIIGSIEPDEGTVEILGKDISTLNDMELDDIRKQFGVLFQSGALFSSMTVGENVALPMIEHTKLDPQTIEIMVKIKLEQVGLRSAEARMPAEISGGMKKRAGLARAISLDPELLFYEEPSAGLDPVTSAEIDILMLDLA
ncbi:MAG: ATP-binding cassette domain-containing protein, partial [Pseudomonadales bacterium]|nr:ATP-binding cassette domain-containing protein [Pseudomonadales bacterium]